MRNNFVIFAFAVLSLAWTHLAVAQNTCAKVEMLIEQTLTLEREGFEARLELENGTPADITDFSLTLRFSDENGVPVTVTDNPNAQTDAGILFFYRYLPLAGETALRTEIRSQERASYKYLIVPTSHAAKDKNGNELANGRLYYVGATITYTQAGQVITTEVVPDFITVRPMPELELEYFLPGDVFSDDPTTSGKEEPEPFSMGVRVVNHSAAATAKKLRIESAQPRITQNSNGLLIDFKIIGADVNGLSATPSLLANFGDIAPRRSSIGSWVMTTSLSGRFTAMSGEVSHAPEFGGALTSLIPPDGLKTYRLLGRVKVNFPNTDGVLDFLATRNHQTPSRTFMEDVGASSITVHASDNDLSGMDTSTSVVYRSSANIVSEAQVTFNSVALPTPVPGVDIRPFYLYARIPVPGHYQGGQVVSVTRVGGQRLPTENAWISKLKNQSNIWEYTLNIFDCLVGPQGAASYSYAYNTAPSVGGPLPEIIFTQNNAPISGALFIQKDAALAPITVSVTDNGPITLLRLSVGSLPFGASFIPSATSPGGLFNWPEPRVPQSEPYEIVFRADDGINLTRRTLSIRVISSTGIGYDAWKEEYWPGITDPDIVGEAADPDHDEIPNLMEYALLGNPTQPDDHNIQPRIGRDWVHGREYLTLTFDQRDDDQLMKVQVAGANSAFAPNSSWLLIRTAPLQDEMISANRRRIKIRDDVPLSPENPQRYLRIIINR
jgi:hypothetical protein